MNDIPTNKATDIPGFNNKPRDLSGWCIFHGEEHECWITRKSKKLMNHEQLDAWGEQYMRFFASRHGTDLSRDEIWRLVLLDVYEDLTPQQLEWVRNYLAFAS